MGFENRLIKSLVQFFNGLSLLDSPYYIRNC